MPLVDGTADRASDPQPEPSLSQQPLSNPKPRQESGPLVETLEDSAALLDQPPASPSLLLAEVANPITNRLQLTLSLSLWSALSVAERDQNAMAWLRSAEQRGFDAIELVDADDRPLGRSARVGEGMILFDPPSPA